MYTPDQCQSGCIEKSDVDEAFHGFLTTISKEMGASVSLFDIPTLYNTGIQKRTLERQTYIPGKLPVHTLCEYESTTNMFFESLHLNLFGYSNLCTNAWHEYITRTNTKNNPYLIKEGDSYVARCANGLGNLAK